MRKVLFAVILSLVAGNAHATAGVGASGCIYATIAAAIAAAGTGDTVYIAPGTYFENLGLLNRSMTLQAANAGCSGYNPGSVFIDAGNSGRVAEVASSVTTLTMRGLRLQNGSATDGGLVLVRTFADLELEDTILIRGIVTGYGGAIRAQEGAAVRLSGTSRIYGSTAAYGGGVSLDDSSLWLLDDSHIGGILFGNTGWGSGVHAANDSIVTLFGNSRIWLNVYQGIYARDSQVEVYGTAGVNSNGSSGIEAWGEGRVTVGLTGHVDGNQGWGIKGSLTTTSGFNAVQVDGSVSDNGEDGVSISGTVADFRPGVLEDNGGNGLRATFSSTVTMKGTRIARNKGGVFGGGIYLEDSTLTGINVKVVDNVSTHFGGGMWTRNSTFSFDASFGEDCNPAALPANTYCSEFRGNKGSGSGGAIIMQQWSSGTIQHTAFIGNSTKAEPNGGGNYGSAIYDYDIGDLTVRNCLFRDNATYDVNGNLDPGTTVRFMDTLTVTNSTFAGNLDETIVHQGSGTFARNIISDNPNVTTDAFSHGVQPTGSCNLIHDPSTQFPLGGNNITLDPLFVTTARGNYHLAFNSPARDACPFAGAQLDLDGDNRPSGPMTDRGAFEDW